MPSPRFHGEPSHLLGTTNHLETTNLVVQLGWDYVDQFGIIGFSQRRDEWRGEEDGVSGPWTPSGVREGGKSRAAALPATAPRRK